MKLKALRLLEIYCNKGRLIMDSLW